MECLWVEYNEYCGSESCEWEDAYKEMVESGKDYKNQIEFTNNFCRLCLEGKKIEFMNSLRCSFLEAFNKDAMWEEKIAELIIEKLME